MSTEHAMPEAVGPVAPRAIPDPGISTDIVEAVRRAILALGLDPGSLRDASIVPSPIVDEYIDLAATRLENSALGIAVAERIPVGTLGVLDYALCTSANIGEGLRRVAENYAIATQRVRPELVHDEGGARFVFHRVRAAHSRHWAEFASALIATRIRQTLGERVPMPGVKFAHDAPPDASAHDAFFGAPVEFGAPSDEMWFSRALLERPLITAQNSLARLLEAHMRGLAAPGGVSDPFIDRVPRTIAAMLDDGETDVGELARRLGMSKRSLQRALAERGTSHSAMLESIREDRARRLLDAGQRIADVAEQLGFASTSAFFRAYRRWTGTSPMASRAARGSAAVADIDRQLRG